MSGGDGKKPSPKEVKIMHKLTVRVPQELNNLLNETSKKMGLSKNSLILSWLWEQVEEKNLKNKER